MSESAPQNAEKTLSSRAPAEWFGSVILGNLKNPLFWLTVALLVLAIMLIFYGILQGEVIFWGLPALQFYPWRDFAMSEFAAGRFPLWNPYNGAGAPLLANYQSAIFYPPHLLYFLFRDPRLMGWLGMLHVLWAGIGMWLFTGRLKSPSLPHFARAIAALSYPLCNTLIARFGTIPMLEVATWLPWLLLATDLIIEGYTLRRWLLLAIVLAMMLLAGHAQWTFYSLILAGCYALWMIASARGSLRKLVPFFLAGAFAVLICAVQLLPTAEFQRLSQRADRLNEGFALNFSYSPVSLVTLFNPDFFGNPGDGSYVIGGLYFETALYIGFIPILFALIGIYRSVGHKQGRFFALVAVIAILLATGRNLPLYPLLYRYVPTFNLFQAPARWLLLAAFALAILAAYGAAAFEATYKIKRRLRLLIAAGAGTAVIGAVFLVLLMMSRELVQMLRGVTWLGVLVALMGGVLLIQPKADSPRRLLWQIALLFVIIADLTLANRLNNPLVAPDFYSSACPPATPVRLFFSEASDTALRDSLLSYDDYRATISNAAQFRCSNLANLNLLDRQPSLNNFDPLLTAWFAEFIAQVNDNPADERLAAALRREIKLDGVAQIVAETPQQITIAVDATKDTRLVLMDTYYPGWAATVDGAATEIQQADIAFRAISVPAGEHTVVMTYDPASFKIGAIISLLSLIGLLALLSLPRIRILLGN